MRAPRARAASALRVLTAARVFVACVDDTRADAATSPRAFAAFQTDAPPYDATVAAGPQHLLAALNYEVKIFDKSGHTLRVAGLDAWFSNVVAGAQLFDPYALYDHHADRFILLAAARNVAADQYWLVLSVSDSPDPLGTWRNSADGPTTAEDGWTDFPRAGLTADALYITRNIITGTDAQSFNHKSTQLRVVAKATLYGGGELTTRDVPLEAPDGTVPGTVHPCHAYGAPAVQYLVSTFRFQQGSAPKSRNVFLWEVTGGATSPQVSRHVLAAPSEYGRPLPAIPQVGMVDPNSLKLWGLACNDDRPRSAVFRSGSVWTAFNTSVPDGHGGTRNVVTWLEIAVASRTIVQQGCYGAPGCHYAYPAIMPDSHGNAVVVAVRSSPTEHASLLIAHRLASMPAGVLHNSSELIQAGLATHQKLDSQGANRWADYNGIALDPTDDRIWVHGAVPEDIDTWASWISSWKAP